MIYLRKKQECQYTSKKKCVEELVHFTLGYTSSLLDNMTLKTIEDGLNEIINKYIKYGVLCKGLKVKCTRHREALLIITMRNNMVIHDIESMSDLVEYGSLIANL